MTMQTRFWAMILSAISFAPCVAHAQTNNAAAPGDVALAMRFAELGRDMLRGKTITEPNWRASAALLQAACRLDPSDPRYPRLLLDAQLQAHNADGAIDAIKSILQITPNNIGSQTNLIDIYVSRMESADAKLAYLRELVSKPPVGDQVRSHAAALAARILLDQSEPDKAAAMLVTALHLNPLNIDALRLHYQMIAEKGTSAERVAAMLSLLRANPAQPSVMAGLAAQLADAGLTDASLQWYQITASVGPRAGWPAPAPVVAGYASELFISGHVPEAQKLVDAMNAANPSNVDTWFLKLVIDKSAGSDTYVSTTQKAGVALANRLAEVRQAAGQKGATTRPIDSATGLDLPNLADDLSQLKARVDNRFGDTYASALADIAWYQVYFLDQPITPQVIDFLHQVLPSKSLTLARLDGWNALVQHKTDEAKVKLSAVADRDPLARLGLLRLAAHDAKSNDATNSEARKLVSSNPSGLVGAMLWGALKGNSVQIVRNSQADLILEELNKFPMDLLKIIDSPKDFYAIRGEPVQIAHSFGEPLLIELTIQNLSDFDLTIGPDGIIHPDLWFDAHLRGGVEQMLPGVAYDRIAEQGVLKARQGITQIVRIDQGSLGQFLSLNPNITVQVYVGVMTNPQPAKEGLMAGPGGYRVEFPRVMERQSTTITAEPLRQKIYTTIANGNGAEKIRGLEILTIYSHLIRSSKEPAKDALAVADEMNNVVRNAAQDPSTSVQAWASYMNLLLVPQDQLPASIKAMFEDKSWEKRLLALTAEQALTPEQSARFPHSLGVSDPDSSVALFAKAASDLAAIATTQPAATQP